MKTIVLAGGCFWCTEAVFKSLRGVEAVTSGYTGGDKPNPTYYEVCNGDTGHAEAVEIKYDEAQISLQDLLTVFFASHDPTTLNRQGADVGTQYRSAIFYEDEAQADVARDFIKELNASSNKGAKIVTEVTKLDHFWPAEEDQQDFYDRNPQSMYCELVINPKLEKVQQKFAALLKK